MARRTAAQRAATARMLAARAVSAGRSVGTAIARRTRTVIQRVPGATRTIVRTVRAPRRLRRAGAALARGGGVIAIAQARMAPAAVGGYLAGKVERNQRLAAAEAVRADKPGAKGAMIKDPTNRLLAQFALTAVAGTRVSGMAREALCGYAGALGCLYEMYTAETGNPDDAYIKEIKAGHDGI